MAKSLNITTGAAFLAVALFGSSPISPAQAEDQPSAAQKPLKAVVELFTSQGCSSCPKADALLGKYARQGDVLALSFHVDYWNYLGWKDTFSKAEFTDRQRRYAASFKRNGVYTPQAVVNGRNHAVGSRPREINGLMNSYAKSGKGLTVALKTSTKNGALHISSQGGAGTADNLTLWLVAFDRERSVNIQRGENRGRTITYHNVVRNISMLGMATDGAVNVSLPLDELQRSGSESFALILQSKLPSGTPGPIVGATVVDNLGS